MTAPEQRSAARFLRRMNGKDAGADITVKPIVTVTSVTAGVGGAPATVTVNWRGNPSVPAFYLSSYTPVVGHRVQCSYNGAQLTIEGRPVGTT